MAGTAVKFAVLMIVVASVCFDVCKACGECQTPVHYPPKTPKAPPYKTPPTPKAPKSPKLPPAPTLTYPPPMFSKTCPVALVQLSVCSPLLGGVVSGLLPSSKSCCALLNLLGVDLEVCLCLALDANILGLISVDAKVDAVITILTTCGYYVPPNFSCPKY